MEPSFRGHKKQKCAPELLSLKTQSLRGLALASREASEVP